MLIVAGFFVADIIMLVVIMSLESVRYSVSYIPDREQPGRHTEVFQLLI